MELDEAQTRHALTVLARLAQREPAGAASLAAVLRRDPERLAPIAAEVAAATGPPSIQILAEVIETAELTVATLREVRRRSPGPDVTVAVIHRMLDQLDDGERVRRCGLLIGLAGPLQRLGRPDEAARALDDALRVARRVDKRRRELIRIKAFQELALLHAGQGRTRAALDAAALALRLADRHLGKTDPRLAAVVYLHGTLLFRDGSFVEAAGTFERSAALWRELLPRADLGTELIADRLNADAPGVIHVVVGFAGTDLWSGPMQGAYRVNTVLNDEEAYLVEQLSPAEPPWHLTRSLLSLGRCQLMLGRPSRAVDALTDAHDVLRRYAREDDPDDRSRWVQAALDLAIACQIGGQAAEATRRFDELIGGLPGDGTEDEPIGDAVADLLHHVAGAALADRWTAPVEAYLGAFLQLTRAYADTDARPLAAAVRTGLEEAIRLKNTDHPTAALRILDRLAAASEGVAAVAEGRISVLVAVANAYLRMDRPADAVAAGRAATEITDGAPVAPELAAGVWHVLARGETAAGDHRAALAAEQRGIEVLQAGTAPDPTTLIVLLDLYTTLLEQERDATPPEVVTTATRSVLDLEPAVLIDRVAMLGFSMTSAVCRARDRDRTIELYAAFAAFAARNQSTEIVRRAHAMVCWNVMMCLVDTDAPDAATTAVLADAAALAERYGPDDDLFVVEHAKTTTELMVKYWHGGRREDARKVTAGALPSLRSPAYLAARHRDIGDKPKNFLATLDAILAGDP